MNTEFLNNEKLSKEYEQIIEWLKTKDINDERLMHLIGSEQVALELAKRYGADEQKASLAALIHDSAKCLSIENSIELIKQNDIEVTPMELKSHKTLHAPISAFFAEKELGINDKEILDAIRYHTIGRKKMTLIDKIIFLSDKIEPLTREESFRNKVWSIINNTNNLDEALIFCYDATIRSLLDRKLIINPQTIEVYNHLLLISHKKLEQI